jgi:hypothetical protein
MTTTTGQIEILDQITDEMEVLNTRSEDAGVAYRAGLREVRKYAAQGYTGEVVGVIRVEEKSGTWHEEVILGRRGDVVFFQPARTEYADGTFYRPVISPKYPTGV